MFAAFVCILSVLFGINIGLWAGKAMMEKIYKPLIDGYKKDVDYWFNSYMTERKKAHDNYMLYIKECIDNIGK